MSCLCLVYCHADLVSAFVCRLIGDRFFQKHVVGVSARLPDFCENLLRGQPIEVAGRGSGSGPGQLLILTFRRQRWLTR
jgi:hypothetical protein